MSNQIEYQRNLQVLDAQFFPVWTYFEAGAINSNGNT